MRYWKPGLGKIAAPVLLIIAGTLCWWLLTEPSHNFLRLSEEGIVVFYYSLLVLALSSKNYTAIGITTALCLLSRYWIAGWVPAMLILLLLKRHSVKQLYAYCIAIAVVFLLLVILPFGWEPFRVVLELPNKYIAHAERIWHESPQYFHESMGWAKFFGKENIKLHHTILAYGAFIVPVAFILLCHFLDKRKQLVNAPLACLKITVVFMCTFIDVPYQYLFYTSSFVSMVMIVVVVRGNTTAFNR